jgi:hypothetical protein
MGFNGYAMGKCNLLIITGTPATGISSYESSSYSSFVGSGLKVEPLYDATGNTMFEVSANATSYSYYGPGGQYNAGLSWLRAGMTYVGDIKSAIGDLTIRWKDNEDVSHILSIIIYSEPTSTFGAAIDSATNYSYQLGLWGPNMNGLVTPAPTTLYFRGINITGSSIKQVSGSIGVGAVNGEWDSALGLVGVKVIWIILVSGNQMISIMWSSQNIISPLGYVPAARTVKTNVRIC